MKIKTDADLELLDQRIQSELGIDVKTYKNEEVAEKFFELLVFPQYIISWVARPVGWAILLYIAGFFIFDLVHIEYVLYLIIGFGLFLCCGVLAGLLLLVWKMRKDMFEVISFSLEIMKQSIIDLGEANQRITPENRKEKYSLLFQGIIHLVTIPITTEAIAEKIPLIGGLVKGLIKGILSRLSNFFDQDKVSAEQQQRINEIGGEKATVEQNIKFIDVAINVLDGFMTGVFRIAQAPLLVFFISSFLVLGLFVYLIN